MTIHEAVEVLNRHAYRGGGWRMPNYPGMDEATYADVLPRRGENHYEFLERSEAFERAARCLASEGEAAADETFRSKSEARRLRAQRAELLDIVCRLVALGRSDAESFSGGFILDAEAVLAKIEPPS